MSLRSLTFLGLYGVAIAAALVFPPAGVWGFLFESNCHPPFHWWGKSLSVLGDRWSFVIGAAMIAGVAIHWPHYAGVKVFGHPQTVLLLLFTGNAFAVSCWSKTPEKSWSEAVDLLKWFAVYVCIVKTHSDRRWLAIPLYIYIFAMIDAGFDETFGHGGGRTVGQGPVTAFGENFVSAHVVALLPLTALLILTPGVRVEMRCALALGMPFSLNLFAHASSRGATLSLLAAGTSLLLFSRGRYRWLVLVATIIGALLAARLFHEQFWTRMATISTYEADASAMGRIDAWKAAAKLAAKNPFGYGAEAFDEGLGASHMTGAFHSTHNMFFEVLVAWGIQGTALFFGFILLNLFDAYRLQRRLWRPGIWPQSRGYVEALGLFVGMIAMLVAAIFLNRARWELWWVFPACLGCLKNITCDWPDEEVPDEGGLTDDEFVEDDGDDAEPFSGLREPVAAGRRGHFH